MFVIDRFEMRDLVPLMELANRTLQEEYPPQFFLQMSQLQPDLFRVARDAHTGAMLGFILANQSEGLQANVLLFAVDPEHQGQGIGRSLLKTVQRTLAVRDVKELDLEVRPDNMRALWFYQRHGFSVQGRESGVYSDGSDALRLVKPIF